MDTTIGDYSFQGATNLTTVTISNRVTSIGQYAHDACTALATVNLTNATSLATIYAYAFNGCTSLTTLDLSKTAIGTGAGIDVNAFAGSSLTTVIVPSTVSSNVYSSWTASVVGMNAFTIQVASSAVVCFLKGTQVLTSKRGYVAVEKLCRSDILLNNLGKEMNVLDVSMFSCEKNQNTHPYLIPKGTRLDSEYKCNEDLYLSPRHEILLGNKFMAVQDLGDRFKQTELVGDAYEYYHITTDNYFTDVIMANGIPSEGFGMYMCMNMDAQFISGLTKYVKCDGGKARKLLSTAKFMRLLGEFRRRKSGAAVAAGKR